MRLLIHKDYESVCRWAADYIISRISAFAPLEGEQWTKITIPPGSISEGVNHFTLGLPTGSTPLGVYRRLVEACKEKRVSFANVITFNMDEYLGLPGDHPQSYRHFMMENLFNHIDIRPGNIHLLDGMTDDVEAECAAYEQAIQAAGGIKLFLGGIGGNGHLAFNEPGASHALPTRVVAVSAETRAANARFFGGDAAKVPARALTVGISTVMGADEVLVLASGRQKARALQAAVEGGINQLCPASFLQLHPNAVFACDEDAAGELKYGTVRYFKEQA